MEKSNKVACPPLISCIQIALPLVNLATQEFLHYAGLIEEVSVE